jgi:hypothetical protein
VSDISQLGLARTNYCTGCKARQDTIEAQAAEIKRLREVLGRIAEETDHDCETMWVTDIVRAALGETSGE